MKKHLLTSLLISSIILLFTCIVNAQNTVAPADRICGQWMSSDKNLTVNVYHDGSVYKGKVVWFKADDNSKTMEEWTDKHNPDPKLRSRKLLGLLVLNNLTYNARSKTWEGGKIYESRSGKTWDAAVKLVADDQMRVTGYWRFKFIGRDMAFSKVVQPSVVSTY